MLYQKIYDDLITYARANPADGYTELHHIIPRILGGSDDQENLIRLSARRHFIAHLLLAKIHGGKLAQAAFLMSSMGRYTNRKYEWLRIIYCQQKSQDLRGNTFGRGNKGKPKSPDHRKKIGTATSKNLAGRKLSESHRLAIIAGMNNPEVRQKISNYRSGRSLSLEHKKKIAQSLLGTKRAPYKYKPKESGHHVKDIYL